LIIKLTPLNFFILFYIFQHFKQLNFFFSSKYTYYPFKNLNRSHWPLTHNISKIYTSNAYFITLTPHYSLTYRFSAMHRCFLDTLLLFCMKPWYKVTDSYALRNFYEEIRFDDFPCIYYRMYPFLSLFLG
jgi:hypothetical protein